MKTIKKAFTIKESGKNIMEQNEKQDKTVNELIETLQLAYIECVNCGIELEFVDKIKEVLNKYK